MITTQGQSLHIEHRLPADDYHSRLDWLSSSMFKAFLEDPRLYEARYVTKTLPGERTAAMDLGTVGHAAILEPHIITDACLEIPASALTKDGKKMGKGWDEFLSAHPGKILLKSAELQQVRGMFEAVYRHPLARRLLLADGPTEESIFWTCGLSGVKRRCRPDKMVDGWGWVNLKTTTAGCDPEAFRRSVWQHRYDWQQEFYRDAGERLYGERPKHVFVLVEQDEPHAVRVYDLGERFVVRARDEVERGLVDFAQRQESGDWSTVFEQEVVTII